MSHTIDEFPPSRRGRGEHSKYDRLMDGRIWVITEEEAINEFLSPSLKAFRGGCDQRARTMGYKLRTSIQDGVAYIQKISEVR